MKIYYPAYCTICDNMAKKESELCEHLKDKGKTMKSNDYVNMLFSSEDIWEQIGFIAQRNILRELGYKTIPRGYLKWSQLSMKQKKLMTDLFKKEIKEILAGILAKTIKVKALGS